MPARQASSDKHAESLAFWFSSRQSRGSLSLVQLHCRHERSSDERAQCRAIERPVEFACRCVLAQYGHAFAVAAFQFRIAVDENAVELRHACLCEQLEREVAEPAIVALVQYQMHRKWRAWTGAKPAGDAAFGQD